MKGEEDSGAGTHIAQPPLCYLGLRSVQWVNDGAMILSTQLGYHIVPFHSGLSN